MMVWKGVGFGVLQCVKGRFGHVGVIPVLRLRSMRAMVRGDIHAVLSVCKDWV